MPWKSLKSSSTSARLPSPTSPSPIPQNNPDKVVLKGVPPDGRKDLLDIVSERLPEYNLSSGAENTWTLTMKPQMLTRTEEQGRESGHRDYPQPHRSARRERADHPGARPRPISDSGAVARRGRSRPGKGHHAVHRHARDQAGARWTLCERPSRAAGQGRGFAAGRDSYAGALCSRNPWGRTSLVSGVARFRSQG